MRYWRKNIHRHEVKKDAIKSTCLIIILMMFIPMTSALRLDYYNPNLCELVAKDFQKEFGGSLVLIVPTENGRYILGEYTGHWINKLYIKGNNQYFYFDWQNQLIFSSEKEVKDWYQWHNMEVYGDDIAIFDVSEEHPPFPITWH